MGMTTAIRDLEQLEPDVHLSAMARLDHTLSTDHLCLGCYQWIAKSETTEVVGTRFHNECGGKAQEAF